MRYSDPPTSHTPDSRRQLTLSLLAWVVGFCAIDFAVLGSLIRSAESDVAANVVVGIMVTAYLLAAFIVIAAPSSEDRGPTADRQARGAPVQTTVRGYPVTFSCNSRYLNGGGFFNGSGFKSLSMRWIELTLITASLDSVYRS
jgi:hypothetical protein